MASRYTISNLRIDVGVLNGKLEKMNHKYRFEIEQFNGATWVSIATPEQKENHCIQRRIQGGTPRECYHSALEYVVGVT